jgi:hypothetical protein
MHVVAIALLVTAILEVAGYVVCPTSIIMVTCVLATHSCDCFVPSYLNTLDSLGTEQGLDCGKRHAVPYHTGGGGVAAAGE